MIPSRSPATVLMLCAALLPLPAASAGLDKSNQMRDWLERMGQALRTRNYQGTFVYVHEGQIDTMEIVHRFGPDGEKERLVSLNGSGREVVRDNGLVKCILPDSKSVLVERRATSAPFPRALAEKPIRLGQYYEFVDMGHARIIGRLCKVIGVLPKDRYRYGYRLCLDRETALPLKTELVTDDGRIIEQVMFTALTFPNSIPDAALEPRVSGAGYRWHVRAETRRATDAVPMVDLKWDPRALPSGFRLTVREVQANDGRPVQHVVFSDGLAAVSVFAEPVNGKEPEAGGLAELGGVNVFGRVVGGHLITVVGEVPVDTVRQIGTTVTPSVPRPSE